MRPPVPQKSLWRQMPPALFPVLLGLFGVGLAWRRAAEVFGLGPAPADVILGAVSLIYLFCLGCYLRKFIARPGVLVEDLRVLPGRAGLAAMTMSLLALAAAVVPVAPVAARALLFGGLAAHGAMTLTFLYVWATGPAEQRRVTPAWHLSLVGFILAPYSAVPLGLTDLASTVFTAMLVTAGAIYAVSLVQILSARPPGPLRPLLAIHLAPVSLLAGTALMLGKDAIGLGLSGGALVVAGAFLASARWMTATGMSPLWGAFTFPAAAFAGLLLMLSGTTGLLIAGAAGGLVLLLVTVAVPVLALRLLQSWARGTLGAQTNAARA